MSDESRITALADNWLDTILIDYVNRPFGQTEAIACRAAILAKLPPDWCGHEAVRLRKIEEAGRALVSDAWYREGEDVCTLPTRNLIRLRAALAGKP